MDIRDQTAQNGLDVTDWTLENRGYRMDIWYGMFEIGHNGLYRMEWIGCCRNVATWRILDIRGWTELTLENGLDGNSSGLDILQYLYWRLD